MSVCLQEIWHLHFKNVFFSPDAVVRTSYYKYFHPKEVYVSNGVLNRYSIIETPTRQSSGVACTKGE